MDMQYKFVFIQIICVFINTLYSVSLSSKVRIPNKTIIKQSDWHSAATDHRQIITDLLYPSNDLPEKQRHHLIATHPIYNFMHRYYRFSANDLKKYSPGLGVTFETPISTDTSDSNLFHPRFLQHDPISETSTYIPFNISHTGIHGWPTLLRSYDILTSTLKNKANYRCFGFHEWAMLYSGNSNKNNNENKEIIIKKHQENLNLRISQEIINNVVESNQLYCTHFDAWRFFHKDAQILNHYNPIERNTQSLYEQPACIHANMDLFKYAYQAYPLISSRLLLKTLKLAIKARIIDMRASPYDVSQYTECNPHIEVEVEAGRKVYIHEQEKLASQGYDIRRELIEEYELIFNGVQTLLQS
eukprot:gene5090-10186_t